MFHNFFQNFWLSIEIILIAFVTVCCIFYVRQQIRIDDFDEICSQSCVPNRYIVTKIDDNEACLCDEGHGFWRRSKNNIKN